MFLGSREEILSTITHLIDDSVGTVGVAVAFWGMGSESLIDGKGPCNIICNLEHPGTNPYAIEKIRRLHNVSIKQLSVLHAKVVIGSSGAYVGSANFSERALGISRSEQEGWVEAGVFLQNFGSGYIGAGQWFDQHWAMATEITDNDISSAKVSWLGRGNRDETAVTAAAETVVDLNELFEEDVFELKALGAKSRNRTRMASEKFRYLYFCACPEISENKYTVKVPAHAANLLWTLSGKQMNTNIPGVPIFQHPDQVIKRAQQEGTSPMLMEFMIKLAQSPHINPPPAIRHWAQWFIKCSS